MSKSASLSKTKSNDSTSSRDVTQVQAVPVDVEHQPSETTVVIKFKLTGEILGEGSFGTVYKGVLRTPINAIIALKTVAQESSYKNRELDISKMLRHPNIIRLYYYYYTTKKQRRLHMLLEYMPTTLGKLVKHFRHQQQQIPLTETRVYLYQLVRALAYLHIHNICHRDVKPQNMLVNTMRGILKLCDFGSAKILSITEHNISYICSRYYRAPELLFESRYYTTSIDIWAIGCVLAELLIARPVFPGSNTADMIFRIASLIGTPSEADIDSMNPTWRKDYHDPLPRIPRTKIENVILGREVPSDCLALLDALLVYQPDNRPLAKDILAHSFFHELFKPGTTMAYGRLLPPGLRNFTEEEMSAYPHICRTLANVA